jgi:fibronectin type 3 domain-containing protein
MLRWEPGGGTVKVYRKAQTEENETLAGTSAGPEFLDAGAVFGTAYVYRAQRAVAARDREAASEFSAPVSITPVDTFAPAVPAGLIVQAGIGGVEIAWDRNQESDLRGYQVWRADGPGPMQRMGEAVATASFSDKSVTAGTRYRYAVSAIDLSGNESKPCEPAEVIYQ